MKKKPKENTELNKINLHQRRSFIKKLGMGIIATSAYTVFSMTQFACKKDPSPSNNGGY
ncbi:MAG TPA: hypothetical protein PLU53_06470 [Bacteroidia bacterium]|nr:hypothetical protein [Bacteroidia bacterium]